MDVSDTQPPLSDEIFDFHMKSFINVVLRLQRFLLFKYFNFNIIPTPCRDKLLIFVVHFQVEFRCCSVRNIYCGYDVFVILKIEHFYQLGPSFST